MTNLAEALRNFYKRDKGRVVFQNGMSLNQLALEMWERLDFQEIDPSVISRVLKGERLFTPYQLKVFASIFHLSKKNYKKIENELLRDYFQRFGPSFNFSEPQLFNNPNNFIGSLTNYLSRIKQIRTVGHPAIVQNLIDIQIELIDNIVSLGHHSTTKQSELLRVKGLLLSEKAHSITDNSLPQNISENLKPTLNELRKIYENLKEPDLKSRFCLFQGGMYAIQAHYSQSDRYQRYHTLERKIREEGLKLARNPSVKFELMKGVIVGAGYLKDEAYLNKNGETEVFKLVEDKGGNYPIQASYLLNNLAIGKSLIQASNAIRILERSWQVYNQEVKKPNNWLEAHLIRGTLQVLANLKSSDSSYAESLFTRMQTLSQYGFKRHLFFTKKYLKNINKNKPKKKLLQ